MTPTQPQQEKNVSPSPGRRLSWVAISDSTGTTQFSGRIRQGEERTFKDNQLLYVVIGNAGAITLTVNGEDIGVPGSVGEVVRLEFGPQAATNQG